MLEAFFWVMLLGLVYAYPGYPIVLYVITRLLPVARSGFKTSDDGRGPGAGRFESAATTAGCEHFERPAAPPSGFKRGDETAAHADAAVAPVMWPKVTMLISAYNEEKVLAVKLENALKSDYPADGLEIMVVSDASTDRTDQVAAAFASRGVRLVRQASRLGKTAALNMAVSQATSAVIVFTDADAMYIPSALQSLVRPFVDPGVGFVSGRTIYVRATNSGAVESINLYAHLESFIKRRESQLGSCIGADGAIFAIRRELYSRLAHDDINDFVTPLQIIARGFRGVSVEGAVCLETASDGEVETFDRQVRITNRTLRAMFKYRRLFNVVRFGWFSFFLISHKLMKFLTPLLMLGLLAGNALLAGRASLYAMALTAQGLFYGLAVLGALHPGYRRFKVISMIFTFSLASAAMLKGWWTFMTGRVYTTWIPGRS